MVDTIVIYLDCFEVENPFEVLQYLTNVQETSRQFEEYKGTFANFNVRVNCRGIIIDGSLAKYYLPSNVYTLTRKNVELAVGKLSRELDVDLSRAIVWRLDFSTILPMKQPPVDYYSLLGNKARCTRVRVQNSLYYNTKRKVLVFYDKMAEATDKQATIPNGLERVYLLRYELRFLQGTQKQLKKLFNTGKPITLGMIYQQSNYNLLVRQWKKEFDSINKNSIYSKMDANVKNPKEAINAIFSLLIQRQGGQEVIDECLAVLKEKNTFTDPKNYTRLKSKLNEMVQAQPTDNNELLDELQKAVDEVARLAR